MFLASSWALAISCVSLVLAAASLWWQISTWRLARRIQLEVRFGHVPDWGDQTVTPVGIEVVNHSDFPVSVQDVQLVVMFGDDPRMEPVIVGLRANSRATIPGVVQPHDSGFIASGIPELPAAEHDDESVTVYANAITAVGNVRTPAYDVEHLPPFPAPMRFSRLLHAPEASGNEEQ